MKKFLFDSSSRFFGAAIIITTAIANSVVWAGNGINKILGRLGYALMHAIDKDRLKMYEDMMNPEAAAELHLQGLELKLLGAAQQVRDHAKETGDWTDNHTDAINAVGEALVVEAGWQEENVHVYLKEIVESIEGLEYGTD